MNFSRMSGTLNILLIVQILIVVIVLFPQWRNQQQQQPLTPCPLPEAPSPPLPPEESAINTKKVMLPYLKRMRKGDPQIDFERLLEQPIDVVIVWRIQFSNAWKIDSLNVTAQEARAFLQLGMPVYRACTRCQFWLWTSMDWDMFPTEVQAAFAELQIPRFFYPVDTLAKLLMAKYFYRGQLLTIVTDNDDTVEAHFFDKLWQHVEQQQQQAQARPLTRPICYRPRDYLDLYPFAEPVKIAPSRAGPHSMRIMMGLYVDSSTGYNDVLSMDHMTHSQSPRVCNPVPLDAYAFYTRRLGSSSVQRSGVASIMDHYRDKGLLWRDEQWRYNVSFVLP